MHRTCRCFLILQQPASLEVAQNNTSTTRERLNSRVFQQPRAAQGENHSRFVLVCVDEHDTRCSKARPQDLCLHRTNGNVAQNGA